MKKIKTAFLDIFNGVKYPITEVADNMATFLCKKYTPEERVLILQNLEKRVLADLQTEQEAAEAKAEECKKAIINLKSGKNGI